MEWVEERMGWGRRRRGGEEGEGGERRGERMGERM